MKEDQKSGGNEVLLWPTSCNVQTEEQQIMHHPALAIKNIAAAIKEAWH